MAIAVDQVHMMGYIHRDIKPENFLITKEGNLKLTDFGLSHGTGSNVCLDTSKLNSLSKSCRDFKQRLDIFKKYNKWDHKAFSLVGSPDYIAIEIVENNGTGYDYAVDYWSIGCLMFECLTGYPPFTSNNIDEVWANVRNWQKVLKRPIYNSDQFKLNMSDRAWDLISQLITYRKVRLDSLSKLQQHSFFRRYSFGAILQNKAPFIPKLGYSTDTRHFDDFSNEMDMELYAEVLQRHKAYEQSHQETIQNDYRCDFINFDYDYNS
jgi:serine/threonine protein kinase